MYLFHFLSHYSAAYTDRKIKNYDFSLPYKCNILPNLAILKKIPEKFRKNSANWREINRNNSTRLHRDEFDLI